MFKAIRCGLGFGLVILISPPDAVPDTPDIKYYRFADWKMGDYEPNVFNEVSVNTAMMYFSGQADGLGYEIPPEQIFATLEEATKYFTEKREERMREILKRHGIPITDEDEEPET